MSGESDDLEKLLASVADGESIDWDSLERAAKDEPTRELLRQLRLISDVAEVHRSQVDEIDAGNDATVTAPIVGPDGTPLRSPDRRVWPQVGRGGQGAVPTALGVWGHLLLVRKIGEGSFGEVYHAHDTWLDHPVALKLLKRDAEERVPPAQLLHEARKLARVRHTNVVTVHGADRHNGRVGFWMDFVDGDTLAARVAKGRLSAGEAVSIGQEVCRALAAVHQAKLIHRDVKAQNVMRAHDGGRIILMDFGAGEFVGDSSGARAQGTPLYLAPELLRGEEATVRSDIYAVGVLLYHLVTGRFPVEAASPAALLEAHTRGERRRLRDERPDLPDSFITIVERALDPDPARRYASAGEMEAKLSGEPSSKPITIGPVRAAAGPGILKRIGTLVAATMAVTLALGFIASRFFEVVLQVDRDFWLGFRDTLRIGISAVFPYFVLWLFGAAVLGAMAIARLVAPKALFPAWNRLRAWSEAWDGVTVATLIFLSGSAAWTLLNFVLYRDLFATLFALHEATTSSVDLEILGPVHNEIRRNHLLISVYLSMLLGVSALWFPQLETRTRNNGTVRLLKWGTLAVAFLVIATDVMPRRILWETYPEVVFDERRCLVIGSVGNELLLYAPDEPGRPRIRVARDAIGLIRTGQSRALFDREEGR